jgi:hypothetical protein
MREFPQPEIRKANHEGQCADREHPLRAAWSEHSKYRDRDRYGDQENSAT